MDAEKAQVYAEQGSAQGLVDADVQDKKDKLAKALEEKFAGYDANLNQTEMDDLEIHKTNLALEKEKQLKAIEH